MKKSTMLPLTNIKNHHSYRHWVMQKGKVVISVLVASDNILLIFFQQCSFWSPTIKS